MRPGRVTGNHGMRTPALHEQGIGGPWQAPSASTGLRGSPVAPDSANAQQSLRLPRSGTSIATRRP
ncbi:hypothetical protein [Streptomyces sp. NPDC050564]|uniref:hypothetical protein n=1 Tax=Streptomyces sp. NPDC050564 TaxID=3365631 RepID=UPI0037964F51